ncbi:MAG TPA: hypothetical protein VFX73_00640 [Chitinophagaceae bacterium]|nr:hypothetical protein [Chitinophagaceae bacterium]
MKHIFEKHPIITCFLIVLIAFLPIASFQFAIKNDFFSAYFPLKFFLSESLHAGNFPLWNPYLNYGFPVYGDMSLGYWNPGTWMIASVPGYNAYSFTAEMLLYLLLAVWGMYMLSSLWLTDVRIRQLAAVSYACSGFVVGHLQHFNWITGAALIPVCLYFLITYQRSGELKKLLGSLLSCFWLLTSAHPGISIGFIIFCIPLLVYFNLLGEKKWARITVLFLATLVLSGGMIYGYSEVLPYTNRNSPIGNEVSIQNSTTTASWISFFFSMPITKNDAFFRNDISMRNCFMGILLLGSLAAVFFRKMRGPALYFSIVGLAFLILSSELILPFYKEIPLVNYVRLNSEFRLFALLSFILGGSISLQEYLHRPNKVLQRIVGCISILIGAVVLFALWQGSIKDSLSLLNLSFSGENPRQAMKALIAGLTMEDTIIIHGSIQLVIGAIMIKFIRAGNVKRIVQIGILEIILATLLNLPFTGVGQLSPGKINNMVRESPQGLPSPSLLPEYLVTAQYPNTRKIIGSWELYSKEIAMDSLFPYPLIFTSTLKYFDSGNQEILRQRPPFFFIHDSNALIPKNFRYHGNTIEATARLSSSDTFLIKQNNYMHWKASIQGKTVPILSTYNTLMAVPVQPGNQTIRIEFQNPWIKIFLLTELILFIMLALAYAWIVLKKDQRIRYIFP